MTVSGNVEVGVTVIVGVKVGGSGKDGVLVGVPLGVIGKDGVELLDIAVLELLVGMALVELLLGMV